MLNKVPDITIENAVRDAKQKCYELLHCCENKHYNTQEVLWCRFLVRDWVKSHVVVPTEGDGSFAPISVNTFLTEQEHHLADVSPNGDAIYLKLSSTTKESTELWNAQGNKWQAHLCQIVFGYMPQRPRKTKLQVHGFM